MITWLSDKERRDPKYGSKRHSLHAVELSQRSGKPCANCVDPSRPQQWVPNYRFLGKPAMRTHWMAGNTPLKAGDVETEPGPTTSRKQVWICDLCHRQVQAKKQISIRCNRIEYWVQHVRCAGIRLAQYTDTWTCHHHKTSILTTHKDIKSPHPAISWHKPPTHSTTHTPPPPTPPTPP